MKEAAGVSHNVIGTGNAALVPTSACDQAPHLRRPSAEWCETKRPACREDGPWGTRQGVLSVETLGRMVRDQAPHLR